jgi:hypothetical protein
VALVQANQAIAEAEAAGAVEKAPYQYTMAREAHKKAREEWGGSEYQTAEELARLAETYAHQAHDIARYGETDVTLERKEILDTLEQEDDTLPELED